MTEINCTKNHELLHILELEKQFAVDQWTINGLHIWPYIRIGLSTTWVNQQQNSLSTSWRKPSRIVRGLDWASKKLLYCLRAVPGLSQHSFFLKPFLPSAYDLSNSPERVGFFGFDLDRIYSNKGYYNRFSDALIDTGLLQEEKCIQFEQLFLRPRPSFRPFLDISSFSLIAAIQARLLLPFCRMWIALDPGIDLARKWCSNNGLDCTHLTTRRILLVYLNICWLKSFYLGLIRKYRLARVFKICWYGVDGMALAWACRQAGIPFIDIQHGLAGANGHRAYSNWSRIPLAGYELLPTDFWCWTEDDASSIRQWLFVNSNCDMRRVRVVGIPFANFAKTASFGALFGIDDQLVRLLDLSQNYSYTVLVTLQSIDIPQLILDAIRASAADILWLIRCHPTSIDKIHDTKLQVGEFDNVEVTLASDLPLYTLLDLCCCHLTEWSACFYDALAMGKKTIFVSSIALSYFQSQLSSGHSSFADSVDSLIAQISIAS